MLQNRIERKLDNYKKLVVPSKKKLWRTIHYLKFKCKVQFCILQMQCNCLLHLQNLDVFRMSNASTRDGTTQFLFGSGLLCAFHK